MGGPCIICANQIKAKRFSLRRQLAEEQEYFAETDCTETMSLIESIEYTISVLDEILNGVA